MMTTNNGDNITSKNLDRLANFLSHELENPAIATQIPDGAHIFHGSYKDAKLTQGNLELATNILLGMTLGYVEEAPLMMIFEHEQEKLTLIDLSETLQKEQAEAFIGRFQKQNQKKMSMKFDQLTAVGG